MQKRNIVAEPRSRFEFIDALRGFTLLHMIAYHTIWDLTHLFGVSISWFGGTFSYVWQQCICWMFLLISGFCYTFGHHHLRRGLTILGCGVVITLVTCVFMPESRVVFGILTFIGLAMLLMIPLERVLWHIPVWIGLPVCFGLFILTRNIPKSGALGFEQWNLLQLPEMLRNGGYGLMLLGFRNPEIRSVDYFPLIPWIFLFLTGYWLYRLLKEPMRRMKLFHLGWKPLCFLGRHTLMIYMLHQPVLYAILWSINHLI